MSWRASNAQGLVGRAVSRELAQALLAEGDFFATVTNEETGERWLLDLTGWRLFVPARPVRPRVAPPRATEAEAEEPAPRPLRPFRADIDG